MSECPMCGEPEPIYYPPEDADEDGYLECVECGWGKLIPNQSVGGRDE